MTWPGTLVQLMASGIFVIAGIRHQLSSAQGYVSDADRLSGPVFPPPVQVDQAVSIIPQLYLDPVNVLMWALLIVVWIMVLLDAVGQWMDPSDTEIAMATQPRVWPLMTLALLCAGCTTCLLEMPAMLALLAAAAALFAIVAARRAAGRQRPAVGFFAGWCTAVFSATLAGLAADRLSLPVQALSALAILPGTVIGMAAQMWIGTSIGYSVALIWAFCGLAVTTMGSDPLIALAAILGISGMATVLVRAAS